jgi:hypothetical protein
VRPQAGQRSRERGSGTAQAAAYHARAAAAITAPGSIKVAIRTGSTYAPRSGPAPTTDAQMRSPLDRRLHLEPNIIRFDDQTFEMMARLQVSLAGAHHSVAMESWRHQFEILSLMLREDKAIACSVWS